jgi:hypothetical protein
MKRIRNPITGKLIFVGGPTYLKLKENPRYSAEVARLASQASSMNKASQASSMNKKATKIRMSKPLKTRVIYRSKTRTLREQLDQSGMRLSQMKKLPGRGSLGRYKPDEGPFCGRAGGSEGLTFPVNTKKRAINAVSRSVNAPNPEGVRKCATDYAVKRGWITKEDKKRLLKKYEK